MSEIAPVQAGPHATASWAMGRRPYLDNLKVSLIAAIIVIHGILGYSGMVSAWTYTEVREVTLAPATEIVLFLVAAPFGLFLIALLFLVAGLLTPGSLRRKGAARFARDRLLRLGIPFAAYVFVIQPVLIYVLAHPLGLLPGSIWQEWFGPERRLDTGPLWFVGVLLIFSLGYAGWSALARRSSGRHVAAAPLRPGGREVSVRTLAVVVALVAPASFAIRLIWPYGSESGITDLNFWEWPVCLSVFGLGLVAADQGWLTQVPAELARQCGRVTAVGVGGLTALLVFAGLRDGIDTALGGWSPAAAAFAVVDAVLTVFGSVWLLALVQRRFDRRYRFGPPLARAAYGAFIVQAVFLLGIAVLLRPLTAPAEVKALLVATGAVLGSFGTTWLILRFVPGARRVL